MRDSNGQFMPEGRNFRLSIRVTRSELALAHIMARRQKLSLTQYITKLVQTDSEGVKPSHSHRQVDMREFRNAAEPCRDYERR